MKTDTMDPQAALLVMDMQTAVISQLPDYNDIVTNVGKAIATARTRNIPVIYVVVGFRPGMPEVSMHNKVFGASKTRSGGAVGNSDMMKVDPAIAPQADDIVVTKRRISAFTGSDLEVVLRAQGIQHLILTGVATSGVVLSTLREAADKDYRITVLADGCTDRDRSLHDVIIEKIFPFQAEVTTVDQF